MTCAIPTFDGEREVHIVADIGKYRRSSSIHPAVYGGSRLVIPKYVSEESYGDKGIAIRNTFRTAKASNREKIQG